MEVYYKWELRAKQGLVIRSNDITALQFYQVEYGGFIWRLHNES